MYRFDPSFCNHDLTTVMCFIMLYGPICLNAMDHKFRIYKNAIQSHFYANVPLSLIQSLVLLTPFFIDFFSQYWLVLIHLTAQRHAHTPLYVSLLL